MVDITDVEVLHDRVVRLQFSDRTGRIVDLAPFLWGPAFEAMANDDEVFAQVKVDPETGTIAWPNGADLDPDFLHGDGAVVRGRPVGVGDFEGFGWWCQTWVEPCTATVTGHNLYNHRMLTGLDQ